EPVTLDLLARRVGGRVVGDPATLLVDATHDSRQVRSGTLFVAVPGLTVDGHGYVGAAREAGASAVCVERLVPGDPGPALVVADTRSALGPIAAIIHGDPSASLRVVGVTGTNGKTTVTHLLEAICMHAGMRPGVVGTLGARIAGETIPLGFTTPEASDLQRLLGRMVTADVDVAAVEVSSHALALGRVGGTSFAIAAFTNLSQDHLDFHGGMDEYERTKASLFSRDRAGRAVIWTDDPAGARIAASTDLPVVTVGHEPADVQGVDVVCGLDGSRFTLVSEGERVPVTLPLLGDFNVANALIAGACAAELGVPWDTIADGIATAHPVPGRFEIVETRRDCTIVVDYAHTPDGVAKAVAAGRRLLDSGRLIVVVGAGGDRDRAKRPLMGAAAAVADLAVLTSDNPRSEDPGRILDEVAAGAGNGAQVVREVDRRRAIRRALEQAVAGDLVLVLGKGHEQGQIFADRVVPFDDREVVREEAAAC
ncbi:MAG TPA: UDP-N-acetylmuramoyl-L-alanyl-D-glutamate--2,6-diaminopimelate ligase, partial [Acidimicrobiia bacterium]|nr:UDP-N-acetylmuramoyl-L-alanyl-D-glutamate--2,6-diaminopimelate ligase [Acidimicrobiia bacterium]